VVPEASWDTEIAVGDEVAVEGVRAAEV
jgi:hypothetical protein